jgi:hypothetical protein
MDLSLLMLCRYCRSLMVMFINRVTRLAHSVDREDYECNSKLQGSAREHDQSDGDDLLCIAKLIQVHEEQSLGNRTRRVPDVTGRSTHDVSNLPIKQRCIY